MRASIEVAFAGELSMMQVICSELFYSFSDIILTNSSNYF
jgi:hypothetical protein